MHLTLQRNALRRELDSVEGTASVSMCLTGLTELEVGTDKTMQEICGWVKPRGEAVVSL